MLFLFLCPCYLPYWLWCSVPCTICNNKHKLFNLNGFVFISFILPAWFALGRARGHKHILGYPIRRFWYILVSFQKCCRPIKFCILIIHKERKWWLKMYERDLYLVQHLSDWVTGVRIRVHLVSSSHLSQLHGRVRPGAKNQLVTAFHRK